MKKIFDYEFINSPLQSLEIEDVGNCCIQAQDASGYDSFLLISTQLGDSYIQQFGPFLSDIENYFPRGFRYNFYKIPYSESKLSRIIDSFLNKENQLINEAQQVSPEYALNKLCEINFSNIVGSN